SSSPPAASTRAWRACSSRADSEHDPIPVFGERSCSSKKLERDDESKRSHPALACGPPAHLVHRRPRAPVQRLAGDDEAHCLVEANGARIVLVDIEIKARGRYAFGFRNESGGHAHPPCLRRHHDLVELEGVRIDGDEAYDLGVRFRHRDGRYRHELMPPALA